MSIMYVCDPCNEHAPEGCGHADRNDLRAIGNFWVCRDCFDDMSASDLGLDGEKPEWRNLAVPPEHVDATGLKAQIAKLETPHFFYDVEDADSWSGFNADEALASAEDYIGPIPVGVATEACATHVLSSHWLIGLPQRLNDESKPSQFVGAAFKTEAEALQAFADAVVAVSAPGYVDPLSRFFAECVVEGDGLTVDPATDLREAYLAWCRAHGVVQVLGYSRFLAALADRGLHCVRTSSRRPAQWLGIGLRGTATPAEG